MSKKKCNAAYFFASEYASRHGCHISQAFTRVQPLWKELKPEEKAIYEEKAAQYKEDMKIKSEKIKQEVKYEPKYEQKYELKTEAEYQIERVKEENMTELNDKIREFNVQTQKWYFIKFQSFCKTLPDYDGSFIYVLAEIGLIEYSLEDGITNTYNEFIKPEVIPPGYTAVCRDNSKLFEIPLDFSRANSNYNEIYSKILKFIKPRQENNFYAPLFCLDVDREETEYGLDYLKSKYQMPENETEINLKVIDLQTLIMELAWHKNKKISHDASTALLKSHNFDYSSNSRCEFHEEIGTKYCSLGFVKRAAYLISDNLCSLYDITPENGKHLPLEITTGVTISLDHKEFRAFNKERQQESRTKRYGDNGGNNEGSTASSNKRFKP